MTTPWYAMIFHVLTTAHNGHDLLLWVCPFRGLSPFNQLYSPHNLNRYLIHSNGKCPNCIHDIPLSSIGIHLQISLFPRFSQKNHLFAVFSKWNWGFCCLRSPHRGNSSFFHLFFSKVQRRAWRVVAAHLKMWNGLRNGEEKCFGLELYKTIFLGLPGYPLVN